MLYYTSEELRTPTVEEMHEYGYSWDGMEPVSFAKAVESGCCYRLYGDDTEGEETSEARMREHFENGGLFGMERR